MALIYLPDTNAWIAYLRRKLGEPELIHTQRSVGYSLRLPRG